MRKRNLLVVMVVIADATFRAASAQIPPNVSKVELISLGKRESHVHHFGLVDSNATIIRNRQSEIFQYQVIEERLSTSLLPPRLDHRHRPFMVRSIVPFMRVRDSHDESPSLPIDPNTQDVMFARAKVDDAITDIAVVVTMTNLRTRTRSPITFELYKIEQRMALDAEEDVFRLVSAWTIAEKYCDYKFALTKEFALSSARLAKIDRCD